jgi:hypothetical protein
MFKSRIWLPAILVLAIIATTVGVYKAITRDGGLGVFVIQPTHSSSDGNGPLRVLAWDFIKNRPVDAYTLEVLDSDSEPIPHNFDASTGVLQCISDEFLSKAHNTLEVSVSSSEGSCKVYVPLLSKPLPSKRDTYVATDRTLYLPGETVFIRVLRKPLLHDEKTPVQLSILNPTGQVVLRKDLTTSNFGLADTRLPLDRDAPTGTYTLEIKGANERVRAFRVSHFRKPPFSLKATRVKAGVFEMSASHASGDALGDAWVFMRFVEGEERLLGTLTKGHARVAVPEDLQEGLTHAEFVVRDSAGSESTLPQDFGKPSVKDITVTAISECGFLQPTTDKSGIAVVEMPGPWMWSTSYEDIEELLEEETLDTLEGWEILTGSCIVACPGLPSITRAVSLHAVNGPHGLLIRANKAEYSHGEPVKVEVCCTQTSGSVCVDAYMDNRVAASTILSLQNGKGQGVLGPFPRDSGGRIRIVAFRPRCVLGKYDRYHASLLSSTTMVLLRSKPLDVALTTDRSAPLPGTELGISVSVSGGEDGPKALSLSAVDRKMDAFSGGMPESARAYFSDRGGIGRTPKDLPLRMAFATDLVKNGLPHTTVHENVTPYVIHIVSARIWDHAHKTLPIQIGILFPVVALIVLLGGIVHQKMAAPLGPGASILDIHRHQRVFRFLLLVLPLAPVCFIFFSHMSSGRPIRRFVSELFLKLPGSLIFAAVLLLAIGLVYRWLCEIHSMSPDAYKYARGGGKNKGNVARQLRRRTDLGMWYALGSILVLVGTGVVLIHHEATHFKMNECLFAPGFINLLLLIFGFTVIFANLLRFNRDLISARSGAPRAPESNLRWLILRILILSALLCPLLVFAFAKSILCLNICITGGPNLSAEELVWPFLLVLTLCAAASVLAFLPWSSKAHKTKRLGVLLLGGIVLLVILFFSGRKLANVNFYYFLIFFNAMVAAWTGFAGCLLIYSNRRASNVVGLGLAVTLTFFGLYSTQFIFSAFQRIAYARGAPEPGELFSGEACSYHHIISSIESASQDEDQPTSHDFSPFVRRCFASTALWLPQLITDERGNARTHMTLPDDITAWRIRAEAVDSAFRLGVSEMDISARQDLQIDFSLPGQITAGDRLTLPVAVYNHGSRDLSIRILVEAEDGLEIAGEVPSPQTVQAGKAVSIPIQLLARQKGRGLLRVKALGVESDAMEMTTSIVSPGLRHAFVRSGVIVPKTEIRFPAIQGIDDAATLEFKIFPSLFEQGLDGLEDLVREPTGCFEQSTSITYPNIMIYRHLKAQGASSRKLAPLRATLLRGYQKILEYEVNAGGFSLYGKAPHSTWLTAYGLIVLAEMQHVFPVDRSVIQRALHTLSTDQGLDGSFFASTTGKRAFITALALRAFASWNGENQALKKSLLWLRNHKDQLALHPRSLGAALWAGTACNDASLRRSLIPILLKAVIHEEKGCSLKYSRYQNMRSDPEATAFGAMALLESGELTVAREMLRYLSSCRRPRFGWGSTWTTAMVLSAYMKSSTAQGQSAKWDRIRLLSGENVIFQKENLSLDRTWIHRLSLPAGKPVTAIIEAEEGGLPYVCRYSVSTTVEKYRELHPPPRWTITSKWPKGNQRVGKATELDVSMDTSQAMTSPIVHLPLPPGTQVSDYEQSRIESRSNVERCEVRPNRVVLYLTDLRKGKRLSLTLRLRLTLPGRFYIAPARFYPYYDSEKVAIDTSKTVTVE